MRTGTHSSWTGPDTPTVDQADLSARESGTLHSLVPKPSPQGTAAKFHPNESTDASIYSKGTPPAQPTLHGPPFPGSSLCHLEWGPSCLGT